MKLKEKEGGLREGGALPLPVGAVFCYRSHCASCATGIDFLLEMADTLARCAAVSRAEL